MTLLQGFRIASQICGERREERAMVQGLLCFRLEVMEFFAGCWKTCVVVKSERK